MIAIFWLMGILTLVLGALLLLPGSVTKISNVINKIILAVNQGQKLRVGSAISLLLISACTFFLIYYYTR